MCIDKARVSVLRSPYSSIVRPFRDRHFQRCLSSPRTDAGFSSCLCRPHFLVASPGGRAISLEWRYFSGIKVIQVERIHNYILIIMCYWRRVHNYYKGCGHTVNLPDEEIKCDLKNCKFSPKHPPTCVPPQCSTMCWQYRQYPQQYAPQIDKRCPKCS